MITLLTGPNTYMISHALREKSRAFAGEAETYDASDLEPKHLPDLFRGASLFATERLIIIREPSSNKTLWTDLEQWIQSTPDETNIILVDIAPDKRTKTFKQIQKHGAVKEYKDLSEGELGQWLQTHASSLGTDLQPDLTKFFINYVGHDQWRLSSELEKALLTNKPLTRELIQDVVEPYPEATAFELIDAVFRRNTERVEELIGILKGREDPYQFFGLLSSQAYALLGIASASAKRPADIASDLGLHPFVVSKLAPVAKQLGEAQTKRFIEMLAKCDIRIKTSGVDPWQQLQLTMLRLCSAK